MIEKTVFVDEIGNVLFIKRHKVKNINIRLYADGRVKVTLPVFSSYSQAIKVVRNKTPWILKQRTILRDKKQKQQIVINNETNLPFLKHKIKFVPVNDTRAKMEIYNGTLKILYPEGINIENKRIQDFIRMGIIEAMRIEAKNFLPQRVEKLAGKYGFSYRKVFIKNAKTLWGSCSSKNNINLNLHLMRLPERLQDYIILHELAHTVRRNHGPQFWKQLDLYVGDARLLAKELKGYKIDEL
ncbi:MAG: M48 family metallopeptidase [Bacteroidetes bacterium]|nr:M48 family metallopeptidase [Bacteroidota bacterium]